MNASIAPVRLFQIVNELGEEGLIRNGVFTKILGGMRKMQLRVGDIILNHKQVS